jgi:ubiquinone/menaquinone biosynthesis C-methylase UbiE
MKRYRAIAEYYDAEYAESKMLQQDVPFFLGQSPKRRQSILELCVGTARAAIPLAQAGHRVVGVDYAKDLLSIAKRKRDSVGLSDRNLELVYGDVLHLNRREKFDWICIFFNTFLAFPTLEEQDRLLQMVRRHLKPRGRFWIDIFNPDLGLLAGLQTQGFDPHLFHVPSLDRSVFQTTEIQRDIARQVQQVTFHYRWFDADGREHREKNSFAMTWIFPRELQLLLERNGLEIEHMFGNYDGSELSARSPRMIVRCRNAE